MNFGHVNPGSRKYVYNDGYTNIVIIGENIKDIDSVTLILINKKYDPEAVHADIDAQLRFTLPNDVVSEQTQIIRTGKYRQWIVQ